MFSLFNLKKCRKKFYLTFREKATRLCMLAMDFLLMDLSAILNSCTIGNTHCIVAGHVFHFTFNYCRRLEQFNSLTKGDVIGIPNNVHLINVIVELGLRSPFFSFSYGHVISALFKDEPGGLRPAFFKILEYRCHDGAMKAFEVRTTSSLEIGSAWKSHFTGVFPGQNSDFLK